MLVKLELLDNKHGANDIRFHPVAVLLLFPNAILRSNGTDMD